ncbi:hypothetical protein Tco_1183396 [Tanacetum coccineum]
MFKVFNHCLTLRTSSSDKDQHSSDLSCREISIPQLLEEKYHYIKDDIPLVSVYTMGNVTVRGMLIPDEFFTNDIRATKDTTPISPLSNDIEREEESYASRFVDSVFQDDDDDSGNRIEPGSHKEHPETVDDDDENEKEKEKKDNDNDDDVSDDHTDQTLDKTQETGSLETRNAKTQTPIPSPYRSLRTNLSSDKTISKELTDNVSPSTATTSQGQSKTRRISSKYTHIPQALHKICKHQDIMIKQIEKKFVTNCDFHAIHKNVDNIFHDVIPKIALNATNDIIEDNLPKVIVEAVMKERDTFQETVPALISKEIADHAPKLIKELFQTYIQNNVIIVHPRTNSSTATPSSTDV